jgi:Ca2+/H+ antiporter, TMEM165/GDT1 family
MASNEENDGNVQAFVQAFAMIIFSEIGDKTFLITAILAMRHARLLVFSGSIGSLVVMSVLSAEMGHILPTLISRRWTQFAAAVLFLVFGVRMFFEGKGMNDGNEKIQDEMREAEQEIEGDEAKQDGSGVVGQNGMAIPLEEIEEGGRAARHARRGDSATLASASPIRRAIEGFRNLTSLLLGPVFVQAFVLTFLGEWGDRSQIATMALAAAHVSDQY